MIRPAPDRILGLSPRARRFVVPFLALAVAVIVIGWFARTDGTSEGSGPIVGSDLHAVNAVGGRIFVGGHAGAGFRTDAGAWNQIRSLADRDIMAWAESRGVLFAGGHGGLFTSTDGGRSFSLVPGSTGVDAHAIGADDDAIYLAVPQLGVLVSTDHGKTFDLRSEAGRAFMGTIWVSPKDPDLAIAPSMKDGAVRTSDGGRTWKRLGSDPGAISVASDASALKLVVVGMNGVQQSADGGRTWKSLAIPAGTSAAAYTPHGELLVARLAGNRAVVSRQTGGTWEPLT